MEAGPVGRDEACELVEAVVPECGKALREGSVRLPTLLDSLAMMQLFLVVEQRTGLRLTQDQVQPGDFETLDSLAALLTRLRGAKRQADSVVH